MTTILNYFSGKSLENAKAALVLLKQSEELGCWIPGASRKVTAALGKANLAAKLDKQWLASHSYKVSKRSSTAYFAVKYGSFCHTDGFDFSFEGEGEDFIPESILAFCRACQPVATLVKLLDNTRPKPVITSMGVSPTVTATITRLNLKPESVRVCPVEWYEAKVLVNGKEQTQWKARLLWPAGTVHGASKFHATKDNQQCQACGHAIKNPFNWVPLLVDGVDGKTYSLWVGKDCSKKLFGIEIKGELEIEGRV